LTFLALAGMFGVACSSLNAGQPTRVPTAVAPTSPAAQATTSSSTQATAAPAATSPAAAATSSDESSGSSGAIRLEIVADGTQARYRVREQLARLSFPSDAIGTTSAVSGSVAIKPDGSILPDDSKFVVDLTGLTSDSSMRDGFVSRNLLDTRQYPTAEFDMTGASGLATPLPSSGPLKFQVTGNFTAHGTTKPATWDVVGQILSSSEMTATATTSFTFEDYGVPQPRVPTVLSVVDKITLEVDLHLKKAS
jgi:polyisoprenoid-binding protein YceI